MAIGRGARLAMTMVLVGCAGCGTAQPGDGGTAPHGYALPEFPAGVAFHTSLPPAFSPFLPLYGEEATREPPAVDFYDPTSPYFFSYVFIWWLTSTPDLSTSALRDDVRLYYTGLCPSATVSVTLGEPETAVADARMPVTRRSGALDAHSCLGNPVPIAALETSTYNCPDHAAVVVVVSPQPLSSQVWMDLVAIRDGFTCW